MEKYQILIVDDDEFSASLIIQKFESDYNFLRISSGIELLNFFETKIEGKMPDLILMDVHMPGISGYEICEKLRTSPQFSKFKDIPLIFLTANDEAEQVQKGFEVGGNDYIKKPYSMIELKARINKELKLLSAQKLEMLHEKLALFRSTVVTLNHELNNPLTIAFGNLEALERKLGEETPHKKNLNGIHEALKRVSENIKKISALEKFHLEKYRSDGDATLLKLDEDS